MAETDNLKLALPGSNEYVDVEVLNENFRKIDTSVLLALAAAAPYSAAATYAVGAYCTKGGKLYRCTVAIPQAEAWNADHWTETTIGAELVAIYTTLANKAGKSIPNLLTLPLSIGYTGSITYRKNEFGMVTVVAQAVRLDNGECIPYRSVLATLPEGYRPRIQVSEISDTDWWTPGTVNTWAAKVIIYTNGEITFYPYNNSDKATVQASSFTVSFYT